jgi:hypothetical protein
MTEISAWDSMNRVRNLLTVAKCFAAKGVEKDDVPAWIAGTFATLLDLIENEIGIALAQIGKSADDGSAT